MKKSILLLLTTREFFHELLHLSPMALSAMLVKQYN